MKRLYLFIALILGVIGLAGCETTSFEKPSNVSISGTIVSWDAVKDAESYIVIVNNQEHSVTVTSFDLSTLNLTAGSYSVTVVAKKGTTLSLPSASVTFVVEASGVTLTAPIVTLTGHILSWTVVTNATAYQVIVNGTPYTTTGTTYDLSTLNLTAGIYTVTVKATAGSVLSQSSAPKTYTVISVENRDIIYTALLKVVNPSYEPSMDRTDFENDEEYQMYGRMSTMVNLYLDVAISEGMSGVDMANMLTFMVELPQNITSPQPSLIKTELDKLGTFGLTPEIFTSFVMTLGDEFLQINLEEQEIRRLEMIEYIDDFQTDLNALVLSSSYTGFMQAMRPYVNTYELSLFDQFGYDLAKIDLFKWYWHVKEYANYIEYGYSNDFEYTGELTDEYMMLFDSILWNIYYNDKTLFNTILNGSALDVFYDIAILVSDYQNNVNEIKNIEQQIEMIEIVLDMMSNESEHLRTLFEEVITYLQTLYQAIPVTLITDFETLISSSDVSIEELMVFKDEMIEILIETLPEASSFELVYETLLTLAGGMTDTNVTTLVGHANSVATIERNSILLGLEFLGSIDTSLVNEVIAITDGLVSDPVYDPYKEYYGEPDVDFVKVVDLIMLILNHIDGFIDEQQTLMDTIHAVDLEPMVIDFATFAVGLAKTELEMELDPSTYAQVSLLLDTFLLEIPTYMDFYDEVISMDIKLINNILLTQGQMLKDLALFIETEDKNPEVTLEFIELMVDHVMDYRGMIRSDLDLEFINTLVDVLKVPMMGVCLQTGIDDDCDGLVEVLKPGVVDLLTQVLMIEAVLMTELDSITNIYGQIVTWDVEFDLGLMAHVVISLDHIMDSDKALFEDLMGIILTEIIGLDRVQSLLDLTETDLTELESTLQAKLDEVDADLDYLAALDYSTLSETQIGELRMFFDELFTISPKNPVQ